MGRKSSISRLPAEIKGHIETMLAAGAQTLDELIADLQQRYPTEAHAGTLPSRSAVGRYGQKLDRRLIAVRASTDAMKMIHAQAGDDRDERSAGLTALVQTELFEAILALQEVNEPPPEGVSAEDLAASRVDLLAKAAKNIAMLTKSSINLKEFQAKAAAAARKQALEDAADKATEAAKKQGLSAQGVQALRDAIAGAL